VGAVLSRELFRYALDIDKVEEIDYGIGSEPYKREWMSSVRNLERISAYNLRTLQGSAGAAKKVLLASYNRLMSRIRQKSIKAS
jgi:CelD/BcsL family acetyltransferase involved in cellulose biosynthesis